MPTLPDDAPAARAEVPAEQFFAVDVRVGTVVAAEAFHEARVPAVKLRIDFGPALGVRRSSAQLTRRYAPADLVGRQVVAVVNLPPRRVAGYRSEVLVLGAVPAEGDAALLAVDGAVPDGTRVA
jgi:tRNA-binding protein